MHELLVECMNDLLHAEQQLVEALPDMAAAARSVQLRQLFLTHLAETEDQVERLQECFELLGEEVEVKPCKGMEGLVKEGNDVIAENKEKDDVTADLALIAGAQKVEHYEMSGYTTARDLAQQLRQNGIVALLTKSLAEEANPDQLLNQVAQTLMTIPTSAQAVEKLPPEENE